MLKKLDKIWDSSHGSPLVTFRNWNFVEPHILSVREHQKYTLKDERLRDIRHKMGMVPDTRKSNFGSHLVVVWYLVHYDTIIKCDKFYYNIRQLFYHKKRQSAKCNSFITNCDRYYKMWRFYYKMQQLLQNVTFITNCVSNFSKCVNGWYIVSYTKLCFYNI